ncbi:uncharacterized protein UHOD_03501 [Ustilago sp. UG-2017b]|nr:uncharacterized protein UHOD_03501 [Ustilago sp. UG-2017b]
MDQNSEGRNASRKQLKNVQLKSNSLFRGSVFKICGARQSDKTICYSFSHWGKENDSESGRGGRLSRNSERSILHEIGDKPLVVTSAIYARRSKKGKRNVTMFAHSLVAA